MKIVVNDDNCVQFENVYNPIYFKTRAGEKLSIVMRYSGFEFTYHGELYYAKNGELHTVRDKHLKI